MLERRDEHAFDYQMHEGTPLRVSHHFRGETGMPIAIQTWDIPPGGFEGFHRHEGSDGLVEFYHIISGAARMRIGKDVHDLKEGDSALALPGIDHDLSNIGKGRLRVLVVWGPPGNFDMSSFGSHRLAQAQSPGSAIQRSDTL